MTSLGVTKEWCLNMAAREEGEIGAGSLHHPLRAQETCRHEWVDIESMGNNEYFTDVRCVHCCMPGQRDHSDGAVFWPAT